MLRIQRKMTLHTPVTPHALCSFNIYWRNPKMNPHPHLYPEDANVDPENRRIDIMPSVFHVLEVGGTTSTYSYNLLGITVQSFMKTLSDDGFPLGTNSKIFYYSGNKNKIQIVSDSDLYDALIYAKSNKPQSVMLIIEGDFVMTKSELQNMSLPTESLQTMTLNDAESGKKNGL